MGASIIALLLVLVLMCLHASSTHALPNSRSHSHQPITPLLVEEPGSSSSCFYNVYLANYNGKGFGKAKLRVSVSGQSVSVLNKGLFLPTQLQESGWVIPVTTGQTISAVYEADEGAEEGNQMWVTDANAVQVFSASLVNSTTFESVAVASCDCSSTFLASSNLSSCPIRYRNEWRSLSYCQQQLFVTALQQLRNTTDSAGVNVYQQLIQSYQDHASNAIAGGHFLMWQRGFLSSFENALRSLHNSYACLSLPYWDWSADFGEESGSQLYADFGGLSYMTCLKNSFSWWTEGAADDKCVRRRWFDAETGIFPRFPPMSSLELGVTMASTFKDIEHFLTTYPHTSVSLYVAGTSGTMLNTHAPADPLFWLHHANTDRIFAQWQDCRDYEQEDNYEESLLGSNLNLTDSLLFSSSSSTLVSSLMNIYDLQYSYPPEHSFFYRLSGWNTAVTTPRKCSFHWFSARFQQKYELVARVPTQTEGQRKKISLMRLAAASALSEKGDYYAAMMAKLSEECELGKGYYAPILPITSSTAASHHICVLLKHTQLNALFAQ